MNGLSFLKTMELLGLFPSKTLERKTENRITFLNNLNADTCYPGNNHIPVVRVTQIQIGSRATARDAVTLCGSSFSTASAFMPAASSSSRASSGVFPFIRASV